MLAYMSLYSIYGVVCLGLTTLLWGFNVRTAENSARPVSCDSTDRNQFIHRGQNALTSVTGHMVLGLPPLLLMHTSGSVSPMTDTILVVLIQSEFSYILATCLRLPFVGLFTRMISLLCLAGLYFFSFSTVL